MKISSKNLKIYLCISISVMIISAVCLIALLILQSTGITVSENSYSDTSYSNSSVPEASNYKEISKNTSEKVSSESSNEDKESDVTDSQEVSDKESDIAESPNVSEQESNVSESSEVSDKVSSDNNSAEFESSISDVKDDDEFINLIKSAGYSVDKLNSSQLVIVQSHGTNATVYFYEKKDDVWIQALDTVHDAYVGAEGVSDDCTENHSRTPKGLYKLGFAFGCADAPQNMRMEYRTVEPDCYWIDDPSSENYNQWFKGDIGSTHAEELFNYSVSYKYAVLIQYNYGENCVAGKGSAFFLHCSLNQPTAGCVSVPESSMLEVLKWLDDSQNPNILIF